MQKIAFISDPQFNHHDTGGDDHPEISDRMDVMLEHLHRCAFAKHLEFVTPRPAERKWIKTIHSENYLLRFEEAVHSGRAYLSHPDNRICGETYRVAHLSAGAGPTGIDYLEAGKGNIP